jgi:hypothetical protein
MISGVVLAAMVCAGAARAEPVRNSEFSISLGAGLAYELVGFSFAWRSDHAEGYLGIGVLSELPGFALGGRYYSRDDGNGFFLALNLAGHADNVLRVVYDGTKGGRLFWATITPGYRATFGSSFFLQAAIGGGIIFATTFWTTPPSPTRSWIPVPDLALAAGFRF